MDKWKSRSNQMDNVIDIGFMPTIAMWFAYAITNYSALLLVAVMMTMVLGGLLSVKLYADMHVWIVRRNFRLMASTTRRGRS